MKSHEYLCTPRELGRAIVPTLAALLVMALLLNMAQRARLLPAVPTSADPESVVLLHQARAIRSPQPADILLVGDSTCLVGVDALGLSERLLGRPRVLSLALFIWFDLATYGEEVADFVAKHPGHKPIVVLLVSPLKLANPPASGAAGQLWHWAYDENSPSPSAEQSPDWLGGLALRQHLVAHLLSTPLHGSGSVQFGFSSGIERYLNQHRGSLITFGTYVTARGAPKTAWHLAKEMAPDSRAFRASLPSCAKLYIGLTPIPKGATPANSLRARAGILSRWNEWTHADGILTNLPVSLPDPLFSGGGHLNAVGQKRLTAALAEALRPLLR